MLLRINECCGCEVQPSRLLEGPLTINRLVALLMDESDFGRALSTLQVGSTQRTAVLSARRPRRTAAGSTAATWLVRSARTTSVPRSHARTDSTEMSCPGASSFTASERLARDTRVQPEGPYRLGGFCTGRHDRRASKWLGSSRRAASRSRRC